jgi:DNA-binding transcriptional MerR regulator
MQVDLLTERQAAERLNCSVAALRYWRSSGTGPNFVRLGRLVRYSANMLEEFIQQNLRISSSEATATEVMRHVGP